MILDNPAWSIKDVILCSPAPDDLTYEQFFSAFNWAEQAWHALRLVQRASSLNDVEATQAALAAVEDLLSAAAEAANASPRSRTAAILLAPPSRSG
jgi:hypothetical protein